LIVALIYSTPSSVAITFRSGRIPTTFVATFWSSSVAASNSSNALTMGSFDDDALVLLLLAAAAAAAAAAGDLAATGEEMGAEVEVGDGNDGIWLILGESVGVNGGVASLPRKRSRWGVTAATLTAGGRDDEDDDDGSFTFFSTRSLLNTLVSKPSIAAIFSKNDPYE
jgi:hypothetical protein